jgi:hypothetical protein
MKIKIQKKVINTVINFMSYFKNNLDAFSLFNNILASFCFIRCNLSYSSFYSLIFFNSKYFFSLSDKPLLNFLFLYN